MPHTFTHEEAQRGGWARARQHAEWRKLHPSKAEKATRQALIDLEWKVYPEYEIATSYFPQWLDVLAIKDGRKVAIEVDGSHGWHGYNGHRSKMALYDEVKFRWCQDNEIELISIPGRVNIKEFLEKMLDKERINEG